MRVVSRVTRNNVHWQSRQFRAASSPCHLLSFPSLAFVQQNLYSAMELVNGKMPERDPPSDGTLSKANMVSNTTGHTESVNRDNHVKVWTFLSDPDDVCI